MRVARQALGEARPRTVAGSVEFKPSGIAHRARKGSAALRTSVQLTQPARWATLRAAPGGREGIPSMTNDGAAVWKVAGWSQTLCRCRGATHVRTEPGRRIGRRCRQLLRRRVAPGVRRAESIRTTSPRHTHPRGERAHHLSPGRQVVTHPSPDRQIPQGGTRRRVGAFPADAATKGWQHVKT